MTWDEASDAISAAIQANAPDGDMPDGPLLTCWTLVAEWMAPDGQRWLSKMSPPSTPTWQADGMHHEALYGDWPEDD